MTPELIDSIGSLWKLGVVIIFGMGMLLFHGPIKSLINRMTSFRMRRGDTEVALDRGADPTNLLPNPIDALAAANDQSPQESANNKEGVRPILLEPSDWKDEMIRACVNGDLEQAEVAFSNFRDSEPNIITRLKGEVIYHAARYIHLGDSRAVKALEAIRDNEEIRAYVFAWLGRCYRHSNRLDDAISAYETAIESATDDEECTRYTASLAACLHEVGRSDVAIERLRSTLRSVTSKRAQGNLYKQIGTIEKNRGNKVDAALAFEMVAYYRPEDTSARFDAAFHQDHAGMDHLALVNYSTLLKFDPASSGALNNQGISLFKLKMPINSVRSYQTAWEKGETLAAANLGYKLIEVGLGKEADALISAALEKPSPHENVGRAMAELAEKRQEEEKKLEDSLRRATLQQRFFHSYYPVTLTLDRLESLPSGAWFVGNEPVQISMESSIQILEWGSGKDRRRVEVVLKHRASNLKLKKWEKTTHSNEWRYDAGVIGFGYFDETLTCFTIFAFSEAADHHVEIIHK